MRFKTSFAVATLMCCIGALGPPVFALNAQNVVKNAIPAITEIQPAHIDAVAHPDNPALPALAIPITALKADHLVIASQTAAVVITASGLDQTTATTAIDVQGSGALTSRLTHSQSLAKALVTAQVAFNATGTARGAPEVVLLC